MPSVAGLEKLAAAPAPAIEPPTAGEIAAEQTIVLPDTTAARN